MAQERLPNDFSLYEDLLGSSSMYSLTYEKGLAVTLLVFSMALKGQTSESSFLFNFAF